MPGVALTSQVRTGVALALAWVVLAPVAEAATVEVRPAQRPGAGDDATLIAAPGESNNVVVSHPDATTVVIADTGARLTPGAFCTAVDPNRVRCTARPNPSLRQLFAARINTGDGNDRITVVREAGGIDALLRANGGPGSDTILAGGSSGNELNGGGGASDVIRAGPYGARMTDGDTTAAAGPDVLDGGPGALGSLSYAGRTGAVFVDLRRTGGHGERGENDTISGMARVTGGRGDDSIGGNDANNVIEGGAGRDRLSGFGGSDTFNGGFGEDTYRCGRGGDSVPEVGPFDFVERDCESVGDYYAGAGYPAYPRVGRKRLTFRLGCPDNDGVTLDCAIRVGIREASGRKRRVAGVRTRKRGGRARDRLVVPLTRTGRRLVRRRGGVRARVTMRGPAFRRGTWTIRLKR